MTKQTDEQTSPHDAREPLPVDKPQGEEALPSDEEPEVDTPHDDPQALVPKEPAAIDHPLEPTREDNAGAEPTPGNMAPDGGDSAEPGDVPDIKALVEEAERRGYLRGRNEAIGTLMKRRDMLESPTSDEPDEPSEPMILGSIRRSVWEFGGAV